MDIRKLSISRNQRLVAYTSVIINLYHGKQLLSCETKMGRSGEIQGMLGRNGADRWKQLCGSGRSSLGDVHP
jgi:hypothetical protein